MGACCVSTTGIKDKKKRGRKGIDESLESGVPKPEARINSFKGILGGDSTGAEEVEIQEEVQGELGNVEWYTEFLPQHDKSKLKLKF